MNIKDTFSNLKNNLVESKKILLAATALIAIVGIYSVTRHSDVKVNKSSLPSTPTIKSSLTGNENTPYLDHIKEEDENRREAAKKNGTDYAFTLIPDKKVNITNGSASDIDDTLEKGKKKPTLPELPDESGAMPTLDTKPSLPPPPPPPAPKPKPQIKHVYVEKARITQLEGWGKSIIKDMDKFNPSVIYTNKSIMASNSVDDNSNGYGGMQPRMTGGTQASIGNQQATDSSSVVKFDIPTAGTMLSAHFASEVDSRTPGVVLAVVDSGPYAGSRLMGSFQVAANSHKLMVEFSKMIVTWTDDEGVEQSQALNIKALAINPVNLSQGMATYVNRHITNKIGFQLATSFMQGLGQAIQQSGSTAMMDASGGTVVSQGNKSWTQQFLQAGGNSAGQIGNTLQALYGNVQDTIKIGANTPFTLLFVGGLENDNANNKNTNRNRKISKENSGIDKGSEQ